MTKKLLLFFTFLMAGVAFINAQAPDIPGRGGRRMGGDGEVLRPYTFTLGPKVDFNYAIAGNPEDMKIDMKGGPGFNIGLEGNVRFGRPAGRPYGTERFGVQLELLYSLRTLNNNVKNITFNSLEIPLLFQWYFIPQLAVELGPTFVTSLSISPKDFSYRNININFGKVTAADVMLTLGLNCKLPSGFTAEFRYNLGTCNVSNSFRTKVSTVSIGLGWLFPVIK